MDTFRHLWFYSCMWPLETSLTLRRRVARIVISLAVWLGPFIPAADWPQFLGPERNGTSPKATISRTWPKEGPVTRWKKRIGQGFSGPVVAEGKVILFQRVDDAEVVECLSSKTGERLWEYRYPSGYRDDFGFDEGPRATPAITGGKVYTFGAEGMLTCVDLASGKKIWSVASKERFSAGKGFFGMACSPLVEGDNVLVNIGGQDGAGIVAFHQATGKLAWKSTSDEASYSSPVAATLGGKRTAVFFTREGLAGLDPGSGAVRFRYPWKARISASVNAATPLIDGNRIFLSASYSTGAILLEASGEKPVKVWSGDDILSNHYATSVIYDGFLYGFDGRQERGAALVCVELAAGKGRWREEGFGSGTVTLAGNSLLIMREGGELVMAAAAPGKFDVKNRAQILGNGVRAYPALADNAWYARGKDTLICVDLSGSK